MEMKDDISVQTLPNGYALNIGKHRFMYFSVEELVEGFLVHVGLGLVKEFDKYFIDALVTACATWPNEVDATLAAVRLREENDLLNERVNNLQWQVKEQKATIRQLREENVHYAGMRQADKKKADSEQPQKTARVGRPPNPVNNPLLRRSVADAISSSKKEK